MPNFNSFDISVMWHICGNGREINHKNFRNGWRRGSNPTWDYRNISGTSAIFKEKHLFKLMLF
jgi:hypothetical protein